MKHTFVAAMSAVMAKSAILRPVFGDHLRNGLVRLSKSAWLAFNPRTSLEIARLFASPALRPVLRVEPRLMFKFLRDYLATDLSRKERAAMLIHHYGFLKDRVGAGFYAQVIDRRLELCAIDEGGHVHRIWLSFPRTPYSEGDLMLTFEVGGDDLYTLSFTIGPGDIAGLSPPDAMYIARVQGRGKGLDRIRQATRDCHDVSPAMLLLTAAEGVAEALGLGHMVGIGASTQVAKDGVKPGNLFKAYDEFWKAVGGSPLHRNMYHLLVPIPGKPIHSVKRDHRSRTQRKRRFKKAIREQVRETFRERALDSTS
jgi:uncharacterized protein